MSLLTNEIERLEDRLNRFEPYVLAYSATPTFDLSIIPHDGTIDLGAITANITAITITNPGVGQKWTVIFTQDGTGSWTVGGWPSNVKFTGAAFTITGTAGAKSIITLVYDGVNHLEIARALDVR